MPIITPEEALMAKLRSDLTQNDGINLVTQNQINDIEMMLVDEALRTHTSFNASLLAIADVKTSIIQWQNQENGNTKLTHLGVFYGLETTGSEHKMNLSMWAVRLDNSPIADLRRKPLRISPHVFSGNDALLTNNNATKTSHNTMRKHFKDTFTMLYDNRKIIFGAYMKLQKVLDALEDFQSQDCDKLRITFGFMKQLAVTDANCFHVIFRGINSSTNSLSNHIFSTLDPAGQGYVGPKPSCPPFGEPEE